LARRHVLPGGSPDARPLQSRSGDAADLLCKIMSSLSRKGTELSAPTQFRRPAVSSPRARLYCTSRDWSDRDGQGGKYGLAFVSNPHTPTI